MAGGWRRWFTGSPQIDPATDALERMNAAYLDMEQRQSIVEKGVTAAREFFPAVDLSREWSPVQARCNAVTDQFVRAGADPGPAPRTTYDRVGMAAVEAARAVDGFYESHRQRLTEAQSLLSTLPTITAAATETGITALQRMVSEEDRFGGYASVREAATALDAALTRLDAAGRPGAQRDAATAVREQAAALQRALDAAPARESEAAKTLTSVRTRLSAVRHRAERVRPTFSELLREFNEASSRDLVDNERRALTLVAAADAEVSEAATAGTSGDPEAALRLVTSARAKLTEAEQLVDAVTDRLRLLREVRSDPAAKANAVRFRLRDAQRLVVSRGLVPEWGSVLDAQVDRIDRITEQLTGRHPDYWTYLQSLDSVGEFVSGVVTRIRHQPAK